MMPIPKDAISTVSQSIKSAIKSVQDTANSQGAKRVQGSSYNPGAPKIVNGGGKKKSVDSNDTEYIRNDSWNPGALQIIGASEDEKSPSTLIKDAVDAANAAADSKGEESAEQDAGDRETGDVLVTDQPVDMFYKDFNAYSADNLNGTGIYDFMIVDPDSAEDRAQWQAITSDPTMGRYWSGDISEAGGFDPWYDEMTSRTIDDVMTSQELQRMYFNNAGGDTMNAIYQGVAHDGFIPDVTGDQWQQDEMYQLYASDPDLSAATMMYLYGVDALYNDDSLDLESDPLAVAKLNDYLALGNMQFGIGDGYSTDVGDISEADSFNAVNPDQYYTSIEKGWSSVPGYGIPVTGAVRSKMYDRYGTGYQEKPEVTSAYQQAYSSGEDES